VALLRVRIPAVDKKGGDVAKSLSMSFSVSEEERKIITEYTKNKHLRKPSELIRLALFGYMRKYPLKMKKQE